MKATGLNPEEFLDDRSIIIQVWLSQVLSGWVKWTLSHSHLSGFQKTKKYKATSWGMRQKLLNEKKWDRMAIDLLSYKYFFTEFIKNYKRA